MPRGDKRSYTGKQKRQAEHIEEGYEKRGVSGKEAEARAWATVNKMTGGGKKSGSGRGKKVDKGPARKGGRKGGKAAAKKRSTKKATRKKASKKKTSARKVAKKKSSKKRATRKKKTRKRSSRKS
ncbi:MAG TPA: plasmid stabilization protein [Candidatus Binatia bacterium]|nr:plasmid stabilization protein [Candidatus Binatia bacterium]